MAIVLFTTPEYMKSVSILDENIDDKKIKVAILEAQEIRLKRLLGSTLYNKYVTDITDNGAAGVTGVYKTLMDNHIIHFVRYWAMYELAPFLAYNYRNKGVQVQNSDNAQPVDLQVVQMLRDEHQQKAEWYGQQMVKYLIQNATSYPEYDNNPDYDDLQSEKNNYDSPIYTGVNRPEDFDIAKRYEQL